MVPALLSINVIVFISTFLSMLMFNNKLNTINNSVDTYLSSKSYKPTVDLNIITRLIDTYEKYDQEDMENTNIDILLKNDFYTTNIGMFHTAKVEALATKGHMLIWIITIVMFFLKDPTENTVMLTINITMGLTLLFFKIYFCFGIEKNKLQIKMKNCLCNEYPVLKKQKIQEERLNLEKEIIEEIIKEESKPKEDNSKNLLDTDIEQFIKYFTS